MDDAQIIFLDFPFLQLLVEHPQSHRRLGGNDDAAGVAVDAVDQRRRKALLVGGVVFPLFVQIALDAEDEGVGVFVVVGVHQQTRLFVQQQHVLVLVDDVQLPGGVHKLVGGGRNLQRVVRQEQIDLISFLQAVGGLAPLAVEANILFADGLVQQGHG